jgi:hypothetical protein
MVMLEAFVFKFCLVKGSLLTYSKKLESDKIWKELISETRNTVMSLNVGDIIFQLFSLTVPLLLVFVLIQLWRSAKKRNEQLKRIEEKLNQLEKKS